MLGQPEKDRRSSYLVQMFNGQVDRLADNALVSGDRRPDQIGRQIEHGVAVELGGEPFFGQFDPIALNSRKGNFECVALWPNRMDPDRLARFDRRRNDRLGGEVGWDAENGGILDIEELLFVEVGRM